MVIYMLNFIMTLHFIQAFRYPENDETDRGVWTFQESFGIDPPECIESPKSRDNHNGNGPDGYPNMYNWTIPNDPNDNCAIRMRYNISTNDYDPNLDADSNGGKIYVIPVRNYTFKVKNSNARLVYEYCAEMPLDLILAS